ncbi:Alpha/Beta hydrolase protein [Mycena vitilis]|nr:Alpha/Beta hydrolase protein [Mycena vitilis]
MEWTQSTGSEENALPICPHTACCSIPPVESQYTPKGTLYKVGGFENVYVTGNKQSKNAIVCVFDIFAFHPVTQQGADILASALNTVVYMPDFFGKGNAFSTENFPPTTQEGKDKLNGFFGDTAYKARENLVIFGQHLKAKELQLKAAGGEAVTVNKYTKVGLYGFCWGGKVTLRAGGKDTPFESVSIIHPAMLSVADVDELTVPLGIYISKDEPVDEYIKIVEAIAKKPFATKNDNKYYSNMFHGWAAARADLNVQANKEEFEDLYTRLASFFAKTL